MRRLSSGATLTDQVVAALREAILAGEMVPGTLYSVYQLADQLGVSRTPVREAVVRLAEAGMVAFERNRGIRVLRTSARDVQEVFQLRLLLEVPAAGRAATRADEAVVRAAERELAAMREAAVAHDERRFMAHDVAFHEVVLAAAGNRKLVELVRRNREITMTLGASTVDRSRTLADIAAEHDPILTALRDRDPAAARAAMRRHVRHTGQLLLAQAVAEGRDPEGVDPDWAGGFAEDEGELDPVSHPRGG